MSNLTRYVVNSDPCMTASFTHAFAQGTPSSTTLPQTARQAPSGITPTTALSEQRVVSSDLSLLTALRYCDGLRGPIVIYDPNDPYKNQYDVDNGEEPKLHHVRPC
jgi:hypothetical protein